MAYHRTFAKDQILHDPHHNTVQVGIGIVFLCSVLLLVFLTTFVHAKQAYAYQVYGEWEFYDQRPKPEKAGILETKYPQAIIGKAYDIEEVITKQKNATIGKVSYLDEAAQQLFHVTLTKGQMPKTETEVAVDSETLGLLGYDATLPQTISFSEGSERSYQLVGILKPYRYRWSVLELEKLPVAICGGSPQGDPTGLWISGHGETIDHNDVYQMTHNNYAYGNYQWLNQNDVVVLVVTMLGCLLIIVVLFYSMRTAFAIHNKDFMILRKHGATTKTIGKIKGWMLFYLGRVSIPLACLSAILISYGLQQSIPACSIVVPIKAILCLIVIVSGVLFIALYVPQHAKEHKRKQLVHFPHQKLTSLTLAIRLLCTSLINVVLMIVFSVLFLQVLCYGLFQGYYAQQEYDLYQQAREKNGDYIIQLPSDSFVTDQTVSQFFSDADVEGIKQLPGVRDVIEINTYQAPIHFPGEETSKAADNWKETGNFIGTIYAIDVTKASTSYFKPYGVDFQPGMVLFLNHPFYYFTYNKAIGCHNYASLESVKNDGDGRYVIEESIQKNTLVTFQLGDKQQEVLSVTEVTPDIKKIISSALQPGPYSFLVDKAVLDSSITHSAQVNTILLKVDEEQTSFIDQQILRIFHKYENVTIQNNRYQLEDIHDKVLFTTGWSLFLVLSCGMIWCLLIYRQATTLSFHRKKTYTILGHHGVTKPFLIKSLVYEGGIILGMAGCLGALCAYPLLLNMIENAPLEVVIHKDAMMLTLLPIILLVFFAMIMMVCGVFLWTHRKELNPYGKH